MNENLCQRPQFDMCPVFCAAFAFEGVDIQAEPYCLQFHDI